MDKLINNFEGKPIQGLKDKLIAYSLRPYFYLRRWMANLKVAVYERWLGIDTTDYLAFTSKQINSDNDSFGYQPTFYGRLEKMVKYLKLNPEDVFVDIGCGKGRVVFFVALHKLKKVIGVEIDNSLFEAAQRNLRSLRANRTPIEFINIDAASFDAREPNIFFIFHPFGPKTLEIVIKRIKESLELNPRKVRIVYYCPSAGDLLDKQDWLIREGQIENENCLVWASK